VYALTGVSIGTFREAEKFKEGMPNFLGQRFNTIWSLLRTPMQFVKAEIKYKPYCSGCAKCKSQMEKLARKGSSYSPFRILSALGSIFGMFITVIFKTSCRKISGVEIIGA